MMTRQELHDEFWLLTKGVLQDSRIDAGEAKVLRRWLVEHQRGDEFARLIDMLSAFLSDKYVDPSESNAVIDALGHVLATLRC
jgi:hypothetical protein